MELRDWIKKLIGQGQPEILHYGDNPETKNLRDQIDRFIAEKVRDDFESYFSTNISKEQSKKILDWEQKMIAGCFTVYFKLDLANVPKKQVELMRSELLEKAGLMHELRTKGEKFSLEKMKRLAKLMRNSEVNNGSIQLGWLNEKLGIIKQGAEIVFPEYENIRNEFGRYDQKYRLQDDRDFDKKSKGYVLNRDVAVKIRCSFGVIELKNKERYDTLLAGARRGENLGETILEKYAAEILKGYRLEATKLDKIYVKATENAHSTSKSKGSAYGSKEHQPPEQQLEQQLAR